MTCIVAIAEKGKVYMGADSYGSDGYSGTYVANPKCLRNGQLIICCTSTFRIIDLLEHALVIPKVHSDEQTNPDKFIRTHFISAVRACLTKNGHLKIVNSVESGGNFLIGYRGKVYDVQSDFSVINVPEMGGSVGCGALPARGSLWTTKDLKMKPAARVLTALEAAVECTSGVKGPFVQLVL